ncbi:mycothiol synthase [Lysobacter korlensis]|uniref:Mycothiol synthase n=1 Tax=Lysobacter korlensis TaxID=553636 RepID=A0ABV6RVQ7_9GAMM
MSVPEHLAALIRRARAADGAPPFSDQALVDLSFGRRRAIGDDSGTAILSEVEFELVVAPERRRRGVGTALTERVLAEISRPALAWAHGDSPGSRALAERFGFERVRMLLQLRAPVPPKRTAMAAEVRPFRPGADDAAWLELNALAFASHPEQGALTQTDLDARMAEPWFDPGSLLLLERDGAVVASCWLKVEDGIGEFYAVAVHPDAQGGGLGGALVDAGLTRLAELGIATASLYVEGDNERALGLYRSRDFTDHTVDVQWRLA